MAKHLSYAGITLPLSTPEHYRYLDQIHPLTFTEFEGWNFDQPNTSALPTPSIPKPPRIRFGALDWYTGAVRPAWFHAVVNTDILDEIRSVVSDPMTPQSLVMDDSRAGKTITASMYMLPPRPLNQLGHISSDGWLLTLTDQRFYWHFRRGTITTQPSSWSALYTAIANILGISITVDTVDTDFGVPSSKWLNYYSPTPVLLDAVAKQVGQRVVVALDGTVSTSNWDTARADSDNYINSADPVISGGLFSDADIAKYVPASVNVVFLDASSSPPAAAPHVVNKTLASLAITGYGSSTGLTGFTQTLFADTAYDGTNTTAVNNYATAAATAWYGWRLSDVDTVWPGIEPWIPTGWEDCITWTIQKRGLEPFASTEVRRGPWSSMQSGNWYAGKTPTPPNDLDCTPGCGWIAGMATGWCMYGEVLGAYGQCAGIDTSQTFSMRYATGESKWISQVWDTGSKSWVNRNFLYDGGAGPLRAWLGELSGGRPGISVSVSDIDLALDCCGANYAIFSMGSRINPLLCTGSIPATPCATNVARIKVSCTCCSVNGWGGPGWYCVVTSSETCGVDTPTVVELIESDRCTFTDKICEGPYATEGEAIAACIGITAPCQSVSWGTAGHAVYTNKTGDCTCLPDTPTLTGGGIDALTITTVSCPGNITLTLSCVSGLYDLSTGTGGIVISLVSFTAGPPVVLVYDISGYGANCGGAGGTARLTLTSG